MRRAHYESQDDIDARKEELIAEVEAKLRQTLAAALVIRLRWVVA